MCGIAGAFDLEGRRDFPRDRLLRMTARSPIADRTMSISTSSPASRWASAARDHRPRRRPPTDRERNSRRLGRVRRRALRLPGDARAADRPRTSLSPPAATRKPGSISTRTWASKSSSRPTASSPSHCGTTNGARCCWPATASASARCSTRSTTAGSCGPPKSKACSPPAWSIPSPIPRHRLCLQLLRDAQRAHLLSGHPPDRARPLSPRERGQTSLHQYWDLDFPDHGSERRFAVPIEAAAELEDHLRAAVRRRLVGDVPVSCYLSGGLDSTVVLALSCQDRPRRCRRSPSASITLALPTSATKRPNRRVFRLEEHDRQRHECRHRPHLSAADRSHRRAGHRYIRRLPRVVGRRQPRRGKHRRAHRRRRRRSARRLRLVQSAAIDRASRDRIDPIERFVRQLILSAVIGGRSPHRPDFYGCHDTRFAQQFSWEILAQSRERLYSPDMWARLDATRRTTSCGSAERLRRWHPLNQSLYAAYKVMLPGLLLSGKGDRVLRTASTEGRYPFLDEHVDRVLLPIAPEYKLRGFTDKWLLRRVADRSRRIKSAPPQGNVPRQHEHSLSRPAAAAGSTNCSAPSRCVPPVTSTPPVFARPRAAAAQIALVAPAIFVRHGPGGRDFHAALASPLLRRRIGRSADLVAAGRAGKVAPTAKLTV